MRKALAIRNIRGQIEAVYFTDSKDIVSEETTFSRDEWSRGVAKQQFHVDISNKLGSDYTVVGNEAEDMGSGFFYRIFFVKKDKFSRRSANDIIEEYMRDWELK